MKLIKFLFGSALLFSSTSSTLPTTKTTRTYYYIGDYQRLEPGHTNEIDQCERTIISSLFTDADNWTLTTQAFITSSNYADYIGSISFDEEATADGGNDGQLTLQEALNAVWTAYVTPNPDAMPPNVEVGNAIINITAASSCH